MQPGQIKRVMVMTQHNLWELKRHSDITCRLAIDFVCSRRRGLVLVINAYMKGILLNDWKAALKQVGSFCYLGDLASSRDGYSDSEIAQRKNKGGKDSGSHYLCWQQRDSFSAWHADYVMHMCTVKQCTLFWMWMMCKEMKPSVQIFNQLSSTPIVLVCVCGGEEARVLSIASIEPYQKQP